MRLLKIFRAPIYRAHRAVSFAIAQLSCFLSYSLLCVFVVCVCYVCFMYAYVSFSVLWAQLPELNDMMTMIGLIVINLPMCQLVNMKIRQQSNLQTN